MRKVFTTEPNRLKETVKTYSFYLDGEDIVLINSIAEDFLVSNLQNLPSKDESETGIVHPYNWIDEADHKDFFKKLNKLWSKIKIDNDSPFSRDIVPPSTIGMPTKTEPSKFAPDDKATSNKSKRTRK